MGAYYGRLHPSMVDRQIKDGWHKVFVKGEKGRINCFTEAQFNHLMSFYLKYDYAGINLYTEYFSDSCLKEIYKKFGYPKYETIAPSVGKVVFIPKK